jgi:hypothetical protein
MMPLARRASLVVSLLLLTSVGTASAECAWVLWSESLGIPTKIISPSGAFATREACMSQAKVAAENMASSQTPKLTVTKNNEFGWEVNAMSSPLGYSVLLTCLPDTVDPRGPKGTTR